MFMRTRTIARIGQFCGVLLVAPGCARRNQRAPDEIPSLPDRIAPAELLDVAANNAYDVVQQLRPQWFHIRGPTSIMEPLGELPAVYLDNVRYGDLEVLRDIPINEIQEILFVSGPDATNRWGTGVVAGVIEVIRKTKPED